jgi:hypothetical protein
MGRPKKYTVEKAANGDYCIMKNAEPADGERHFRDVDQADDYAAVLNLGAEARRQAA